MAGISAVALLGSCVFAGAPEQSLNPTARPADLALLSNRVVQICGDPRILGRKIAPILGRIPECGIDDPVAVHQVSGITLSTPAKMDCTTAQTLNEWTENSVLPTFGRYRDGVREFHVVGHYSCRTRNNRPGAKVSEHGKGHAIDIAGFRMKDGTTITLIDDWDRGKPGRILRTLHKDACGPFGTVLGPEANAAHEDHFHFDTARYRNGSYCR